MKNLLLLFFILFVNLTYSQIFIYKTKKFSVIENKENSKWSKWYNTDAIVIFRTDTVYTEDTIELDRRVFIYSNVYQEINLHALNYYKQDINGNYKFDFIGQDIWGNDCDFSYSYYKGRVYFVISYKNFAIKYVLRKKKWVSVMLETRKVSFSSITEDGNYISG